MPKKTGETALTFTSIKDEERIVLHSVCNMSGRREHEASKRFRLSPEGMRYFLLSVGAIKPFFSLFI